MNKDTKNVRKDSSKPDRHVRSSRDARSGKFVGGDKTKGRVPPISPSNKKS